jgi:hypothetical protein
MISTSAAIQAWRPPWTFSVLLLIKAILIKYPTLKSGVLDFCWEVCRFIRTTLIKGAITFSRPISCDLDDLGDSWNPSQLMSDSE